MALQDFIPEVREFLTSQNLPLKAVLLFDNAPCHPPAEKLRSADGSIFVICIPPNVTPLIQPMDQNVIRLTKLFYRKDFLSYIISFDQDWNCISFFETCHCEFGFGMEFFEVGSY